MNPMPTPSITPLQTPITPMQSGVSNYKFETPKTAPNTTFFQSLKLGLYGNTSNIPKTLAHKMTRSNSSPHAGGPMIFSNSSFSTFGFPSYRVTPLRTSTFNSLELLKLPSRTPVKIPTIIESSSASPSTPLPDFEAHLDAKSTATPAPSKQLIATIPGSGTSSPATPLPDLEAHLDAKSTGTPAKKEPGSSATQKQADLPKPLKMPEIIIQPKKVEETLLFPTKKGLAHLTREEIKQELDHKKKIHVANHRKSITKIQFLAQTKIVKIGQPDFEEGVKPPLNDEKVEKPDSLSILAESFPVLKTPVKEKASSTDAAPKTPIKDSVTNATSLEKTPEAATASSHSLPADSVQPGAAPSEVVSTSNVVNQTVTANTTQKVSKAPFYSGLIVGIAMTAISGGVGYLFGVIDGVDSVMVASICAITAIAYQVLSKLTNRTHVTNPVRAWTFQTIGHLLISGTTIAAMRALNLISNRAVYIASIVTTTLFLANITRLQEAKKAQVV